MCAGGRAPTPSSRAQATSHPLVCEGLGGGYVRVCKEGRGDPVGGGASPGRRAELGGARGLEGTGSCLSRACAI